MCCTQAWGNDGEITIRRSIPVRSGDTIRRLSCENATSHSGRKSGLSRYMRAQTRTVRAISWDHLFNRSRTLQGVLYGVRWLHTFTRSSTTPYLVPLTTVLARPSASDEDVSTRPPQDVPILYCETP